MVDLMKQNKLVEIMPKLLVEEKVHNINNKLYNNLHNFQQQYLNLKFNPIEVFMIMERDKLKKLQAFWLMSE